MWTLILIGVISAVLLYYWHAFSFWRKKNVPFLDPKFPLGNMRGNFTKNIGQQLKDIHLTMRKKGHAFCGYYLTAAPIFMPLNLEYIKKFLVTDFKSFYDRGFYSDEVNDPMGANLASLPGEKWKKWRERLTPMFTVQKTKMMMPLIEKGSKELADVFENYAENEQPFKIQTLMKRYTIDVICSSAFGVDCNCLKDETSEFFTHANSIFTSSLTNNLRIASGMVFPIISRIFKIELFNPAATGFFRRVMKETIKYREENNIERPDFLNYMIRLKHDLSIEDGNQEKFENNEKEIITDDEIAGQSFVFYLAGFETTAAVLSFVYYELAANQDVQDKLRQEIIMTLSKNNGQINYETINQMRYLDLVTKEILRKYPSVHMLNREVTKDFLIQETNTVVPKGTKAVLSVLGLHHDPEFYPDPEKFDPERFTGEIQPFTYLPFGDGPRICPGLRFGQLLLKVNLATIIQKYQVFVESGKPKVSSVGNVLGTDKPILLKAKRISNVNNNENNMQ